MQKLKNRLEILEKRIFFKPGEGLPPYVLIVARSARLDATEPAGEDIDQVSCSGRIYDRDENDDESVFCTRVAEEAKKQMIEGAIPVLMAT